MGSNYAEEDGHEAILESATKPDSHLNGVLGDYADVTNLAICQLEVRCN